MPDRGGNAASRSGWVAVLGVCAALAGLLCLYLRSAAREAVGAAEAARQRLEDDRKLAENYGKAAPGKLEVSADVKEAHSSEFIERALGANDITPGEIDYRNPEKPGEPGGKFVRVETTIEVKEASLASLTGFLRQMQTGRPQLKLLKADFKREGQTDRWHGSLTYGAVIPARSRK